MITSARTRGWPGDVPVTSLSVAGLPAPSVIRPAKIGTLDASDATRLGKVSAAVLRQVHRRLAQKLGLHPTAL